MKERFHALDVFRGAAVALMILVNNPGSWSAIYAPLDHASWHGCTPTDLVFPFFLFAVGNALSFSWKALESGDSKAVLGRLFKRSLLIFLIGILLNWSPFLRWENESLVFKTFSAVRIMGVLQRIALAYLIAALLIYYFRRKSLIWILAGILLAYWILCYYLGSKGSQYTLEGFWGTGIDRALLGTHIYRGEGVPFDPEGLASTFGPVAQVMIGYLAGRHIISRGPDYLLTTRIFSAGVLLTFGGFCWDLAFPINKKIWTSSYVLYTSGIALLILALLIYLIELRKYKGSLTRFFEVFGKNPLFIFVLSGLLPRLLGLIRIRTTSGFTSPLGWFYENICRPLFSSPLNASLCYALLMVTFYWLVGYFLDRKRIYIKV